MSHNRNAPTADHFSLPPASQLARNQTTMTRSQQRWRRRDVLRFVSLAKLPTGSTWVLCMRPCCLVSEWLTRRWACRLHPLAAAGRRRRALKSTKQCSPTILGRAFNAGTVTVVFVWQRNSIEYAKEPSEDVNAAASMHGSETPCTGTGIVPPPSTPTGCIVSCFCQNKKAPHHHHRHEMNCAASGCAWVCDIASPEQLQRGGQRSVQHH